MDWHDIPQRLRELHAKYAFQAKIAQAIGLAELPTLELGDVQVKSAGAFKPFFDLTGAIQKPLGGPNPLLSTLLGGALGAGAGYTGAALASKLLPEEYFDRKRMRKNWALLGGLAGAALPGYALLRPALAEEGPAGAFRKISLDLTDELAKYESLDDDEVLKKSALASGDFAPIVPVDRFNRMVLSDPNIPPQNQAAAAGLTTAASLRRGGSDWISPMDIGSAALHMGAGWTSGLIAGKTLGALAGLKPDAQQKLQQVGLFAGLVNAVVPMVFGD